MKRKRYTKQEEAIICNLYLEGKSTNEIASIYNTKGNSIRGILLRNKIKLRTISEGMASKNASTKELRFLRRQLYKDVRNLIDSIFWKAKILVRDNFTCQICGIYNTPDKPIVSIQVDHIKPFRDIMMEYKISTIEQARKCEALWDINNGRCLCKACHKKETDYSWKENDIQVIIVEEFSPLLTL